MYCILYWGGVMVNLLSLYLFKYTDVQRVWFNSNTKPVTSGARTDNPSSIHPCVSLFFVFFSICYIYVVFCSAFLVHFCCRLHCLFFFGIFRLFLRKSTWVHPGFWWVRLAHLFSFVCSGFRVTIFTCKGSSVRLYLQLFEGGFLSC